MSTPRRADVAVVGLGAIGLPVCVNVANAGFRVQGWNRTRAKGEPAAAAGAELVESLRDIDAPIVLTALTDTPQLLEVLDAGLRSSLGPGDILVVLSTVLPSAVKQLGADLGADGIRVVDAPVSGGDVGAWAGTLSIMAGGTEEDVDQCRPVFAAFGSVIRHLGPLGSGELAKMCNQIVVGATLAALGEALNLSRAGGLSDDGLLDILAGGLAGSRALDVKRGMLESGDFTPGGSAENQRKDLVFASETGRALGVRLPVTDAVTLLYDTMIERGWGGLDHSAVILVTAPEPTPPGFS